MSNDHGARERAIKALQDRLGYSREQAERAADKFLAHIFAQSPSTCERPATRETSPR